MMAIKDSSDTHPRTDRRAFLATWFQGCEGSIEIRLLPSGKQGFFSIEDFQGIDDFASKHEQQNVHLGMTTRNGAGGAEENVVDVPGAWADIDFKNIPQEKADKLLAECPLQPTIVVNSGGGYHAYWRFREPTDNIKIVARINRQLAQFFESDPVYNAAQILRLPGTANRKYNPWRLVKVAIFNEGNQYNQSDFEEHLPALKDVNGSGEPTNPPGWQDEALKGVKPGSRHHTAAKLIGRYVEKGLSDEEILSILQRWDENNTPSMESDYGPDEIFKIITSIRKTHARSHPHAESGIVNNKILDLMDSNEVGDARLFMEQNQGEFVYDHSIGRWYEWHKHYWKEDVSNKVMAAIEQVNKEYYAEIGRQHKERIEAEKANQTEKADQNETNIKELFKRIRALQSERRRENVLKLAAVDWTQQGYESLSIIGGEWDSDPMVLGCKNGVIDLLTGDFRPGKPEDYIKTIAPTEWKCISTPAPAWERFLAEIFDGDTELIDYVQRLFGYSITGKVSEHKFPILFGKGRNGKGTLLETIKCVLGDLSGPVEAELLLDQYKTRQSGAPTSDLMALRGKRLVWASEIKEGRALDIGKVKWLTGSDTRVGRHLFGKHQITYTPTDSLFLITNYRPRVGGNDYSAWERITLIPFKLSFVDEPAKDFERQRDPDLLGKLRAEASGILAWLVRGCLEWACQGLNPPSAVKMATKAYREDEDIIQHFISEQCSLKDDIEIKAGELYKGYLRWCEETGNRAINGTRFGKEMKGRFDFYQNRYMYYRGIGLLGDIGTQNED